jgi:amino acid adenylation domain-containing protein/non-ribosomal peptide synthase protein (TIGR01720 family)
VVRLPDEVDPAILKNALRATVERHEILRTTFQRYAGLPVQVIGTGSSPEWRQMDWRALGPKEQESSLEALLVLERSRRFDLERGPLLRLCLVKRAPEPDLLIVTQSSMCSDSRSLANFASEWARAYDACRRGYELSDDILQYTSYCEWQNELSAEEIDEEGREFWRDRNPVSGPVQALPLQTTPREGAPFDPRVASRILETESADAIRARAVGLGVPMRAVLLASWGAFLARHSGDDGWLISYESEGRGHDILDKALGLYATWLPVRVETRETLALDEVVLRVTEESQRAEHWRAYFVWDDVSRENQAERTPPFLPVAFQFHERPIDRGEAVPCFPVERPFDCTERYRLKLVGREEGEGFITELQYDPTYYRERDVELLMARFHTFLENAAERPGAAISELEILSKTERRELLESNRAALTYPRGRRVHDLFIHQVEARPDSVAMVFGDEHLTYRFLQSRAGRLASSLKEMGVGPEVSVALCLSRSAEFVIALLAVLEADGAYVPLDPSQPRDRLARMLEAGGVGAIVTSTEHANKVAGSRVSVVDIDSIGTSDAGNIVRTPGPAPDEAATEENLVYVMFTSGSSGPPKGVAIEHRQLVNYVHAIRDRLELGEGMSYALVSTVAADLGNTCLFASLTSGGCLHVLSDDCAFDPAAFGSYFKLHPVDCLKIVPTHAAALQTVLSPEELMPRRRLILGGESCEPGLVERLRTGCASECFIHNHYGPTEATVGALSYHVQPGTSFDGAASVPIGRPLANTEVYVLDRQVRLLPIGSPGELHIGGAGLARGYSRQPQTTAEKFVPHAFTTVPGLRLYRTGDRCRFLPTGDLEFLGRMDRQVKIRGFRVELGEIEAAASEHPAVRRAVTVIREDRPGEKRIVAYVVLDTAGGRHQTAPDERGIRDFLRDRLPEYMVPASVVVMDSLPLTANGKIDGNALPAPDRAGLKRRYVPPHNADEESLAAIWSQVLGVERVGVYDNFFELGGDSIQCIHVVARARQLDLQVTPAQMFQYPTIAELAAVIEKVRPVKAEQGLVSGPVPLSPIQRWFFEQELEEPQHWNMSLLFEMRVDLDALRLRAAVRELLIRHDALRMRFERSPSDWQQFNASFEEGEVDRSLAFVDLGTLSEAAKKAALEEACAGVQASIDLAQGPLFRVVRFENLDTFGRLLFVIHHLVVDGVSWRILLEDLSIGLAQPRPELPVPRLPKTTSFKHWSERLTRFARSETIKEELAYWESLAAADLALLPRDRTDGINTVEQAATVVLSLGVEESRALLSEVHAAYRTQGNDVLLTALVRAFAGWTGSNALRVELEGHGREALFEDVDLSRTVGWFTTRFPVNLVLDEIRDPGEALKSIKEQLRAVPRRGIGYGLHRYLTDDETAESLERARAEVSFNYLGQLDQAIPPESPVSLATEASGPLRSPRGARNLLIEIVGAVAHERFQFYWTFCQSIHERKTIEELAARFLHELEVLIRHCQSPEAGGYTPSDFPLAQLDQASLDRLIGGDRNIEDLYPLSPLQAGMLFHSVYVLGDVYFERLSGTVEGDFDVRAFRNAWEHVVERHGVLRTAIVWNRLDVPLNVVRRRVELPWVQEDWRGLPDSQQSERWEAFLDADRVKSIALDEAPLMRISVVRTGDNVWRFAWSHHHLILDGWSSSRVLREVLLFYQAMVHGRELELDSPRPYRDFVEWLSNQDLAKAKEYWSKVLSGMTAPTSLAIERPSFADRAPDLTNRRQQVTVSQEITAALDALARRNHLTLNSVIQGTWAILLSRYSGETDVMFGVTVSGRTASLAGIESMLGVFINSLPARARVPSDAPLVPWLQNLQAEQAELRGYEFCPLVSIQGFSDVPRGVPLFESLLVYENYPLDRSVLPPEGRRLAIRDLRVEESTNYPLTLLVLPGPALTLRALYDGQLLDPAAVARLLGHTVALLEEIAGDANRPISALSMLTDGECAQLLVEWAATETRFPALKGVHQLLEAQTETTPDAVAVVFGDQHLSYEELNARSDQMAQRLRSLGIGPEERVGVFMPRSLEMALAVVAALKAGAAYVPLDPIYPPERLRFMLEHSRAGVLLTTTGLSKIVPDSGALSLCLDADWRTAHGGEREGQGESAVTADNLAYVIYTSGSTGRPKGVGLSHDALANLIQWHPTRLISGARTLQFASLSFDASFHELFAAWSTGGTVFMVSEELRQDVRGLINFLVENCIEKAILPVVLLQQLAEISVREKCYPVDLKEVITTGEQLQITPSVRELFPLLRGCSLHNHYGPSETHVVTAFTFPPAGSWPGQVPIGRPLANTQIHILDEEGSPVPVGVAGELFIGGSGLARGYLYRPSLTAERFVPNPFSLGGGARLYRTGDRARWRPDGELEFLGRRDFQVKVRGFRVELGEIEAVLSEHPAVQQCAVVSRVDGRTEAQLVAYIVADPGYSAMELKSHLRKRLPEHMVPTTFVALDRLPLTANRKVNRAALPPPDGARPELEGMYVAPRSPVEEELARMWAALLGVGRVGVHDGFFDLGGHSLLATQLISRVREAFGVELSPRDLFDAPTVAGLARTVEGKNRIVPGPPLVPVPREEDPPLSFAQQRLWILDQLLPGNTAYVVPAAVRLLGRLDVAALTRALNEIPRRHEIMRTNFATLDGRAVQRIRASRKLALPTVDLRVLAPARREAIVRALAEEESARPFDLERDPLLRATLVRSEQDEHVVLFTMHHIVSDAWSMGLMVREVATLYTAFSRKRPSPLPDLKLQYADFAHWQRRWLQDEVLERHLRYWRAQLNNLSPLNLETDRPRPSIPTFRGANAPFELGCDLSKSLRRLCQQEGVTLFMTLLAGFQATLRYCTGQDDVAVGTDVANRTRTETEAMMGFFINQLVLRTDLSGDPTFRELLGRVREVTLEAYAHQDLPFEKLVDDLGFERDMSQTPLFQVKLVLQNTPLPQAELPGLSVEPVAFPLTRAKFDLLLNLWDMELGLRGAMTYSTDLFDGITASEMLAVYHRILEWVVEDPDIRLQVLDERLAEAEQSELSAAGREDLLKVKRVSRSLHADRPH